MTVCANQTLPSFCDYFQQHQKTLRFWNVYVCRKYRLSISALTAKQTVADTTAHVWVVRTPSTHRNSFTRGHVVDCVPTGVG